MISYNIALEAATQDVLDLALMLYLAEMGLVFVVKWQTKTLEDRHPDFNSTANGLWGFEQGLNLNFLDCLSHGDNCSWRTAWRDIWWKEWKAQWTQPKYVVIRPLGLQGYSQRVKSLIPLLSF